MNEHKRQEADIVDRAVQAVKAGIPPSGPSDELLAGTLEAMRREASAGRPRTLTLRITNMKRAYRFAAAAALLVAAGLGVGWYLYNAMSPSVAFADVAQRVQNARTFQMTVEAQMPNQPPMRMKWLFKEPSGMRMEMESPARSVSIFDLAGGKMLSLIPAQKQAMTMDLGQLPQGKQQVNYLGQLRKALAGNPREKSGEREIGERTIDGRQAKGYQVGEPGMPMEIWVDRHSGDILLVRMAMPDTGLIPSVTTIMRDFVIDADLDDELFSMEVPAGYTAVAMPKMDVSQSTQQDLATMLGLLAEQNGGIFPDRLDQAATSGPSGKDHAQVREMVGKVVRGIVWLTLEQKSGKISNFHYAGAGVKLGDARPIAWWLPKGAQLYRVLRGDLTFADMPVDQLPAAPTTAPAALPAIRERVSVEISDQAGSNMRVGELMAPVLLRLEAAEASAKDRRSWLTIQDPRGQRAHLPVKTPATLRVVGPLAAVVGEVQLQSVGQAFEVVESPDQPGQLVLREVQGVPAVSTMPRVPDVDAEQNGAQIEIQAADGPTGVGTGTLPARIKFVAAGDPSSGRLFILVTSAKGTRSQIPFQSPATIRVVGPAGAVVREFQVKEPGQTFEVVESPDRPGQLQFRQIQ